MEAAPLDLRRRREIFEMIVSHPGLHLRELERRLGIGLGDLRHHLDLLLEAGLVTSRDDGYRRSFYSVRGFSYPNAAVVSLLRQKTPRRILLLLLDNGQMEFQEIRAFLNVSKSTLSFHLHKLVGCSLVLAQRVGNRMRYRLSEPSRVADVLVQYRSSFLDYAIDRAVSSWMP